jgi:signal transduction histidine kinase/CheY-like chemotaxis protein
MLPGINKQRSPRETGKQESLMVAAFRLCLQSKAGKMNLFQKRIIYQIVAATVPLLLLGLVIACNLLNASFLSINNVSRELQSAFQKNIQDLEKEVEFLTDLKFKNSAEIAEYKVQLKNEAQKDDLLRKGYELRGALIGAAVPISRQIVTNSGKSDASPDLIVTRLRQELLTLAEEVFYVKYGDDIKHMINQKKCSPDFVRYLLESMRNGQADWFEDTLGYRDIIVNLVPFSRDDKVEGVFCIIFDISPFYTFLERAERMNLSLKSSKIQEMRLIGAKNQENQLRHAKFERQKLIADNAEKNKNIISEAEKRLVMFQGLNMTALISTAVLLFWLLGTRRITKLQDWLSRVTADIYKLQTKSNQDELNQAHEANHPLQFPASNKKETPGSNNQNGYGLQARIAIRSVDEIGELCKSINSMLDSLEKTTVSQDLLKLEVRERKNAEQALIGYKLHLEELIDERTRDLLLANKELQSEIQERKQADEENLLLQNQLLQMQKMEAIGTLAGGVAHDFNNILTGIAGFTDLAIRQADPKNPSQQDLKEIRQLTRRGADLTRQLLTFSRQQVIEPVVLDISNLVKNISNMLQRLIGENIRLRIEITSDIGNIKGDPGQIEQVLVNLIVNARDAMPNGGELIISANNMDITSSESASKIRDHQTEKYVILTVRDTGCGMRKATQERAFDPFFTTKDVGRGTGLGLSTVYGIVEKHKGHIRIQSEVGSGTVVSIYFPIVNEKEIKNKKNLSIPRSQNTETILLVEDEEIVREVTRRSLEKFGYMVLVAADPSEAEKIFSLKNSEIDLLLTDIIMPVYDGMVLYENLSAMRPALKVLFMSGYTDKQFPQNLVNEESAPFIQKPFTTKLLNIKIRQVLDKNA